MAAAARQDFNGILTVMLHEDTSSDSSSNDDDDLDFLVVDAMFPPTGTLEFPLLNFDGLSDNQLETMFRFHDKNDMEQLAQALEIPDHYECVQRTTCTGMDALMILLRRLVYPNRWCDLVPVFGRNESQLSPIFNKAHFNLIKEPWRWLRWKTRAKGSTSSLKIVHTI